MSNKLVLTEKLQDCIQEDFEKRQRSGGNYYRAGIMSFFYWLAGIEEPC